MNDLLVEFRAGRLAETAVSPRYYWDNGRRGTDSHCIFQHTWEGEGRFARGEKISAVGPGCAMLMVTGDKTRYYYPEDGHAAWKYGWIGFVGAEKLWGALASEHGDVVGVDPDGEALRLFRLLLQRHEARTLVDRYEASEILGRFLANLARELNHRHRAGLSRVDQARRYIEDEHRRPITVKEVAAFFGRSREHFARDFRAAIGVSPGALLRDMRMATARQLLRGTRLSVHDVARQSGFSSASHFIRAFRLRESVTPDAYRNGPS